MLCVWAQTEMWSVCLFLFVLLLFCVFVYPYFSFFLLEEPMYGLQVMKSYSKSVAKTRDVSCKLGVL